MALARTACSVLLDPEFSFNKNERLRCEKTKVIFVQYSGSFLSSKLLVRLATMGTLNDMLANYLRSAANAALAMADTVMVISSSDDAEDVVRVDLLMFWASL